MSSLKEAAANIVCGVDFSGSSAFPSTSPDRPFSHILAGAALGELRKGHLREGLGIGAMSIWVKQQERAHAQAKREAISKSLD